MQRLEPLRGAPNGCQVAAAPVPAKSQQVLLRQQLQQHRHPTFTTLAPSARASLTPRRLLAAGWRRFCVKRVEGLLSAPVLTARRWTPSAGCQLPLALGTEMEAGPLEALVRLQAVGSRLHLLAAAAVGPCRPCGRRRPARQAF